VSFPACNSPAKRQRQQYVCKVVHIIYMKRD